MSDNVNHNIIRLIGSLTADGVFIYNLKKNELDYTNHSMVRIFDISHDAFKTQPDFFIHHVIREDIGHLLDEFEKFKANSVSENVEFHLKTHDLSLKTVTCNAFLIDDYAIGFVRDISGQRENERYIVNYGAKKDALLDMVSHNLSGPLLLTQNIIESLNSALRDGKTEEIGRHLVFIRESTGQCIEIVNDFLKEEHLTSEHISVKRTRFDVIEKINHILERMRIADKEKRFVLVSDVNALYTDSDEVKFMQIINSLLSNAVKFTPANGKVEVLVNKMARSFTITIADNGIGIPDHLKPHIFEKYTPAGRKGLRGEVSVGMGLYIVQKLVFILNGKITFESEEGAGSTFRLLFQTD